MPQVMGKGLEIGIDLGTSNILVYLEGEGLVIEQPALIAIDKTSGKVISIGAEAQEIIGKEYGRYEVIRPNSNGIFNDLNLMKELLSYIVEKIKTSRNLHVSKLIVYVPNNISQEVSDQIMAIASYLMDNNGETKIEEQIKVAALGTGVNIYEPSGVMVIDIGGGTTNIGIISLGQVVMSKTTFIAGEYLNSLIVDYIRDLHGLEIGHNTAERVKHALATLKDFNDERDADVFYASGRDLQSNMPKEVAVTRREIKELTFKAFESIKSVLLSILEVTPPELAGDLCDNGIILIGGGALIPGIEDYISKITNVPVKVSNNPINAVIDGTRFLLKGSSVQYYNDYESQY